MTKKYKEIYLLFGLLSFLSIWGPTIYAVILAFLNGSANVINRFSLGVTFIVAFMLCALSAVMKYHLRTPIVIILLGIYYFTKSFGNILLVVGVGIILDETLFTPISKKYKNLFIINREIDKR